jgi:hypothetical protein
MFDEERIKRIKMISKPEEVGELNQAVLQNKAPHDIMMEAVQVATMALRVANDCGLVWSEGIEAAEEK